MQYQKNIKIIIDKRKLDVLERLGCPDEKIISLIKTGKFKPTGDHLIDETLECLVDIKEFDNWGGKREGAGRPKKNQVDIQVENQDENHLGNQDANQVADIDKDRDRDRDKDKDRDKDSNTPLININNNKGDSSTVDNVDNSATRKEIAIKIGDLIKRVPRTPFDYK